MIKFKYLIAMLILMMVVNGTTNFAEAKTKRKQKKPKYKTCTKCGNHDESIKFPYGGSLCDVCFEAKKNANNKKNTKHPPKPPKKDDGNKARDDEKKRNRDIIDDYLSDMVYVPGGSFIMGDKNVDVASFYISKTEVTQELWIAVMGYNPSKTIGNKLPVENVSWDECKKFISILNSMENMNYRLPTESEWEFAARGGNKSEDYDYSGSDVVGDVAWYMENSGGEPHEVATKCANELGLYDMSGNVMEWCENNWYSYHDISSVSPERVCRGGSWNMDTIYCLVADRTSYKQDDKKADLGFRLAR